MKRNFFIFLRYRCCRSYYYYRFRLNNVNSPLNLQQQNRPYSRAGLLCVCVCVFMSAAYTMGRGRFGNRTLFSNRHMPDLMAGLARANTFVGRLLPPSTNWISELRPSRRGKFKHFWPTNKYTYQSALLHRFRARRTI